MLKKKFDYKYFFISFFVILMIFYGFICASDIETNPDFKYLYNRAYQMLSCLKDGYMPWYYYNDFGGVGYGSSFFYGQLTLIPFLWTIPLGYNCFISVYAFITLLLNFLGALFLSKKFSKNYKYIALLYIGCTFSYYNFICCSNLTNLLAIGISFFYIKFLIDFFRDNALCVPCILLYYLILNTHNLTAFVTFLITIVVMFYYFDIKKILSYMVFAFSTCIICLYNICNMLYHSDVLNSLYNIYARFSENYNILSKSLGYEAATINYMDRIPFGGLLFNLIYKKMIGFHLFNFVILAVCIYLLCTKSVKYFSNKKLDILYILALCLVLIAERDIWIGFTNPCTVLLQFPVRYMPYIVLFIFIIIFRNININKIYYLVLLSCVPELLFGSLFVFQIPDNLKVYSDLDYQIINGEYLDNSFVYDKKVFNYYKNTITDDIGLEYDYKLYKDKVVFNFSGENVTLTMPKLYYKGFKLIGKNKEFKVTKGYSQFCTSYIDSYDGILVLSYEHPMWLQMLFFADVGLFIGLLYGIIKKYGKNKYIVIKMSKERTKKDNEKVSS